MIDYLDCKLIVWLTAGLIAILLVVIGVLYYVAKIRQQSADALSEKAAELEQRLSERTAELATANGELEAFCYSVSHDLRAPLRHIHSFSRMLAEEYTDRIDAAGQDCLGRICRAVSHMGALIDDLLSFSRVGRTEIRPVTVNLSRIAADFVSMYRESEPDRPVTVEIAEGMTTTGDAGLLEVVLQNIIGNAWKYTSKNPFARIEFGRTVMDGEEVYYVRDNGIGFNMQYSDKLFKVFERLHGEEFEGTGVGLATVHRIISRHGGRIWAESEPGKGTVFYFTLQT